MNPGYIPHEVNNRIKEIYQMRAQINLEAEAAAQDTAPTDSHLTSTRLIDRIARLLNNLMPVPGRISRGDATL